MKSPVHHTVKLNNARQLHYWSYGDRALPVMVMIHGFRGTHHGLEEIARLTDTHHVIIPDLPGFGASSPFDDGNHSLDNYVSCVQDLIKHLSLDRPPVLLGHSFGSIICASFASRYHSKTSDLILVNPIAQSALSGSRVVLTKLTLGYYQLARIMPKKLAKLWLSSNLSVDLMSQIMTKTKDKNMRRYIKDQHRKYFSNFSNPTMVTQAFIASVETSVSDYAANVPAKTLLIAGSLDDISSLQQQRQLKSKFPDASLEIIDSVGHLTHYETPERVARLVQTFLNR